MTDVRGIYPADRYVSVQDSLAEPEPARLPIPPHPRVDSSDEYHLELLLSTKTG